MLKGGLNGEDEGVVTDTLLLSIRPTRSDSSGPVGRVELVDCIDVEFVGVSTGVGAEAACGEYFTGVVTRSSISRWVSAVVGLATRLLLLSKSRIL